MHRPQRQISGAPYIDIDRFLFVFLKRPPQRFVCSICTVLAIDVVRCDLVALTSLERVH